MKINQLTKIALMTAITAVCAVIAIPIPISPVPITLSIVAVMLSGVILSEKTAPIAQIIYLALGAVGLPIFAGFKSGLGALLGPTGGFLFVYPIMAVIVALFCKIKEGKMRYVAIGCLVSLSLCYTCGTLWLSFSTKMSISKAFMVAVVPFVLFDLIKIVLVVLVAKKIKRLSF